MPIYQNSSVADAKVEVGNYQIFVNPTAGSTAAAATWVNLGAGMVKNFAYVMEQFTCQAGNAVDPLEGISRETATMDIDLIEYDGSSFSILSGGAISGTSGSLLVGNNVTILVARGFKLVNTRKLAAGSAQTTTWVILKGYVYGGFTMTPKSDNDADPINIYSFSITAKPFTLTAGTLLTKTVA
jgi:hypothetical protein